MGKTIMNTIPGSISVGETKMHCVRSILLFQNASQTYLKFSWILWIYKGIGVLRVISEGFYIIYAIRVREQSNPTSYSALQSSEQGVPAAFS